MFELFYVVFVIYFSLYFACAKPSLEEAVDPALRTEFEKEKDAWLPRTDTIEHRAYDKRTPGLFKLEYSGTDIVALCSKTYCVYDKQTEDSKFSCKGVNKHQYKNPIDLYKRVLETKEAESGKVTGFRAIQNGVFTYTQDRVGFSYFYCKRKVLDDGVSTEPLAITLSPPTSLAD